MGLESEVERVGYPTRRKPNILTDLELKEVSLVDRGSNQGAKIALFKRDGQTYSHGDAEFEELWKTRYGRKRKDDPGSQFPATDKKGKKAKKMSKLDTVLKSANPSRDQIAEAIREKAIKRARKLGCSIEKAESDLWHMRRDAEARYDGAGPERQPHAAQDRVIQVTEAESELDEKARKLQKKLGCSYAKAVEKPRWTPPIRP